jgi:hypothetical protein
MVKQRKRLSAVGQALLKFRCGQCRYPSDDTHPWSCLHSRSSRRRRQKLRDRRVWRTGGPDYIARSNRWRRERNVAIAAERIRAISVTSLHPVIGAVIGGVDLCRPLDAETLRQIKDAWHEHTLLRSAARALTRTTSGGLRPISARSPSGCRRSREQPGLATSRLGTT